MNLFDLLGGDPSLGGFRPGLAQSPIAVTNPDPSTMVPGGPMAPQAAVMNPAPPPPPPQPGLMERIGMGLFHIPSGLQSLMTPEDAKALRSQALLQTGLGILQAAGPHAVRPTLMGSIGAGLQAGEQGFNQGLGQNVQAGLMGQQLAQQQKMQAMRQHIAQQFPAQPNETPEQRVARLNNMAQAYANAGDLKTAGELSTIANQHAQALKRLSDMNPSPDAVRGIAVKVMGPDGKPYEQIVDPTKIGQTLPAFVEPRAGGELTPAQSDRLYFTGVNQFQTHAQHAFDPLAAADRNLSTLEQHLASGNLSQQDFMTLTETVQRIVNPGAIVRTQTMNMQKAQTQSLENRLNNLISRAKSGTPDPAYVAAIVKPAREMLELQKKAFYAGRNRYAQTYSKRGVNMQPGDLYDPFDTGTGTPTPTAAPAGATNARPTLDQLFGPKP